LNGRDIILPRFGISWRASDRLLARASFGRFSAGSPDVWISNSYSNTGVTQNNVSFNRNTSAAGCSSGTAAICSAALNNVFGAGPGIPSSVRDFVRTNTGAVSLANVNAIDPNFDIPNQWRIAGTVSYNADLGFLGDNWFFAVDGLYGWVDKQADYVDLRTVQIGTAPDGRPRFGPFAGTAGSNNSDILLTNSDQGTTLFLVGRVAKEWENGLSFDLSYTYADVEERSPLTSSVAFSNYRQQGTANPNGSTLGTSNEQIPHTVKFNLGYRHEFFRDAETRIQLFAEYRQGRPFSYTFDANPTNAAGRDPTFGVFGDDFRHLIYVPTGATDPLVEYDSPATRDAVEALINSTALQDFRGQIAGKNIGRNDDYVRVDLHISQDVPLPENLGRVQVFADMENVLNFINEEWGVLRQFSGVPNQSVVDVTCVAAAGNPCARYRYSNFRSQLVTPTRGQNPNTSGSLWAVRLGVRYEF
jgi:hypothetical protein